MKIVSPFKATLTALVKDLYGLLIDPSPFSSEPEVETYIFPLLNPEPTVKVAKESSNIANINVLLELSK